ncbi:MAG: type II secretion system F family protein [Planctomycetaceae bacterium]
MDPILIVSLAAFVGAAALAAVIFSYARDLRATKAEDRLEVLAGIRMGDGESKGIMKDDLVSAGAGAMTAAVGKLSSKFGNLNLFFEQADSPVKLEIFLLLSAVSAVVGAVLAMVGNAPAPLYPVFSFLTGLVPLVWLWWRRRCRFHKFESQLPDALELLARALRSGHSLNSGLFLVSEEMPAPISTEFQIAYEEQNLGIPIEAALKNMLKRMPNLDLKFFVTAVAIQRQTGGDLAEILDKIGYVIRERFKILGLVKALTGEGRLSGAVLMAMPIAIFIAVYYLNSEYVMLLFTTELGRKMVGVGIVMQIFGAIAIKKIIDIKV